MRQSPRVLACWLNWRSLAEREVSLAREGFERSKGLDCWFGLAEEVVVEEDGEERRVLSISCEVERAFSARVEAAAAMMRGCLVDDDGGGDDDDISFVSLKAAGCVWFGEMDEVALSELGV